MIYERKTDREPVSVEDFDIEPLQKNQTKPEISEIAEQQITPMVAPVLSERQIRKRVKKSKAVIRRKRCRAFMLSAAAMIFCVFTIDARLFEGRLANRTVSLLGELTRFESTSQATTDKTETTLYTRLEYDEGAGIVQSSQPGAPQTNDKAMGTEAVTVTEQKSSVNVDGTTYYPITKSDLSGSNLLSLSNETSYNPDISSLMEKTPSALQSLSITDSPLVLIIHTHGGECYSDYVDMYPAGEQTRSLDTEKNVVRVGKEIALTLSDFGIPAIHCEIMHDEKSFINAYNESAKTVEKYLKEYPSIRFVIDVHRDAIIKNDGEAIKAVENIGGEDYAQLMFVVGTDERGHSHDNWEENLSLALTLQKSIDSTYPGLCRSINLRDVPFNQWLSDGYLLLEAGTCSNTLDEALRSGRAFAQNLAMVLYNS